MSDTIVDEIYRQHHMSMPTNGNKGREDMQELMYPDSFVLIG